MQITDLETELKMHPLLRLAFRPLFLFGAAFSALAILIWGLALFGKIHIEPVGNILFWHSHEMIFGFACAIVIGFLLTAMQNWTGLRAPHGKQLFFLITLWLLSRALMLWGAALPLWLVIFIDIVFLPSAAVLLAIPILAAKQVRNLFFIPILLLLTACNAISWLGLYLHDYALQQHGLYNAVLLITLLMSILGGRVLPMFTANGTLTKKVDPIVWLDRLALGALWLIFIQQFLKLENYLPHPVIGLLYAVAAALLSVRCARWKLWITFKVPLLWSLHLAYWFIPVGLALFAMHYSGISLNGNAILKSTAMHALTAGAMGSMILAMMARVSLGHTGRPLQVSPLMVPAFMLVLSAGISRSLLLILFPELTQTILALSIIFWVSAYSLFCFYYSRILTTDRADGRPG